MNVSGDINQLITPNVRGVIWITSDILGSIPKAYYELNYLLDGLLLKSKNNTDQRLNSNLFLSNSFNKPFFIIHTTSKDDQFKTIIKDSIKIVEEKAKEEDSLIYYFIEEENNEGKNFLNNLRESYPELSFEIKYI